VTSLALACSSCGAPAESPPPILPLRTLRLYETGVGYFERSGELDSRSGMSLPVPAAHLDDALETLVVMDSPGEARKNTVRGVAFTSSVSHGMARSLAGLPAEGQEALDVRQLLLGLKGARVEVSARGATYRGRLVEVAEVGDGGGVSKEPVTTDASKATRSDPSSFALVVLSESGAIVRVPGTSVDAVRPLDPSWATRLGSALDALSTRGARSERLLHLVANGSGPLTLGYVAETPVWRTTYRLVLDDTGKEGVLEGWALLHNDTDEDWVGVRVQLANGRPDSFLFPLAAPRYARRPLVTPDDQLATVPQLVGTTVDALWGDQLGDSFGAGGLGLTGVGEGGGGRGEGIGLGSIGTVGHGSGTGTSSLLDVGNLAATAPASGVEAGALFVYTLPGAVDLQGHSSTLVPFAQQRVDAVAVAWVDSPGSAARSAVRFVNSTTQTLPAGTIAFFGDGGFAGESMLPRLKPGERRFLTFGVDLDVELAQTGAHATEETKRLVWNKGARALEEHYLRTSDLTFSVENRSGHARSVVLAMALARNATLTGPDRVDYDTTSSHPLAIFEVGPTATVERRAHAVEGLERSTPLASLVAARLAEIAAAPSLGAAERAAATEAAAQLRDAEQDGRAEAEVKSETTDLQKDMDRVREEMKALPGERSGAPQANPFAPRLIAAEDKLLALRKKLATLETDHKAKATAAEAALARLTR
jgi:hypothetical protein